MQQHEERAARIDKQQDIDVPPEHWRTLQQRDMNHVLRGSGAQAADDGSLLLTVLDRTLRIDAGRNSVEQWLDDTWQTTPRLVAFVTVLYLANAVNAPMTGSWVTEKDLSCASFFRGFHQLPLERLLERFGGHPDEFLAAAQKLGAVAIDESGDAAVRLWIFPLIPLKLILWKQDEELPAAVTVLFDRNIESYLPADGIWAMVRLLGNALVKSAEAR